MGLADDIKKSFFNGMGEDRLDSTQKSVLDKMSKDISKAIVDFITSQTFTITKMKALLEVEELETTTDLQADVLANRLTTKVMGVVGSPGPIPPSSITGMSNSAPKAVKIPALQLRKFGGQGGSMKSRGYAYIGQNPIDASETNENNTEVKLLKSKVKDK